MYDEDIKIAGNKPSESIRKNLVAASGETVVSAEETEKAVAFGKKIAEEFCKATAVYTDAVEEIDENMVVQRHFLLSFTVTVSFEIYLKSDAVAGIAQKSFLSEIKANEPELYKYTSDTGAFSFYYLAHRRGGEIERRMGQTFAMLCAHDGDPIYQELGEVLYCWFSSRIKELAAEFNLI
ncbi:MAG: hypothetical protein J6V50_01275 [Clostridia bacterium]|nr:hypothetical protein [Clostridia bacterium]